MSFWADQFVDVCYWARQFSLAWRQTRSHCIPALHPYHQAYLSYVRMKLECSMATYQLCRKQKEMK